MNLEYLYYHQIENCCGVIQIYGYDSTENFIEGSPRPKNEEVKNHFISELGKIEKEYLGRKFLISATTVEQTNANDALEQCGFTKQGPNRRIILWTKEF